MTESDKNEEIVKKIIQSLLPVLNKNVLVLFTGGAADAVSYQQTIDELVLTEARIAITPTFQTLLPPDKSGWMKSRLIRDGMELYKVLPHTDLIVIPILTRNTLAKGAMGIQDNLVSMAIAKGFMTETPILAVNDNCDPNSRHSIEKQINRNVRYNRMLLDYEDMWRQFGAVLVGPEEFVPALKRMLYPEIGLYPKRISEGAVHPVKANLQDMRIVTAGDVGQMEEGQTVRLSSGALITPLAQEMMDEKKVIIEIV